MFLRTKTVRKDGRVYQYTYWQQSVRLGKRVKSLHLGKVPPHEIGLRYIAKQIEKYPGDPYTTKKEEIAEKAVKAAAQFKENTGLDLPTTPSTEPVEKSTKSSETERAAKGESQ